MANDTKKKSLESIISMKKAVELLKLRVYCDSPSSDLVPTDVSEINILCPKCGPEHSSRRLTLNINFEKEAFGCPRCSFAGGVYKLVSYYTGWSYDEVKIRIENGELGNYIPSDCKKEDEGQPIESVGRPLAPLRQRHEVYSAMLSLMRLNDAHYDNLRKRGLSHEAIERIGFKSYPKFMDPTVIPKKLISNGLDLRGVPGFGIDISGSWSLAKLPDGGFLIPSRGGRQLIEGCQIRFDHPNSKVPKFGYFTSSGMTGGTKAETWLNWAGEDLLARREKTPFDIILIEGPLKSYIVNEATGCNVIAVPGVSALKKVPAWLQDLIPEGLRDVYIAYDMDKETNAQVASQLDRLRDILRSININAITMNWDSECKGLDDWIVSPHFDEFRKQA